jgi:hypothetical protein
MMIESWVVAILRRLWPDLGDVKMEMGAVYRRHPVRMSSESADVSRIVG